MPPLGSGVPALLALAPLLSSVPVRLAPAPASPSSGFLADFLGEGDNMGADIGV